MNPHQRLSWTLGLSLVIWSPIAVAIFGNEIELWTGGLYYVAILAFTWFGMGIVQRLTDNYRETQNAVLRAKRQIEIMEQQQENEALHRRATDESLDD